MSRLGKIKERTKSASYGWQSQLNAVTVVNIEEITLDPRLQQRVEANQGVVEEYTQILKNGGELAAVSIINEEGKLWLWDGWHTIEAHQKAKRPQVKANIQRGTFRDAWIASLGANDKHGLRRKKEDKEKALKNALNDPEVQYSLLDEDSRHSFRSVAKWTGWSHPSVSNYWKKERLPQIVKAIDEALQQEKQSLMTDKEWITAIALDLYVPARLVEQRLIQLEFNLAKKKEKESEEASTLEAGKFTTRQQTPATEKEAPTLEAGKFTTRQQTPATEEEAPTLEAGKFTTPQPTPARNLSEEAGELEAGKFTTHQQTQISNPSEEADELEAGKFTRHASVASRQQTSTPKPFPSKTSLLRPLDSEDTNESNDKIVSRFSAIFEKATEAEDVTNLILLANAAGANAWRFDEPKFVKVSVISKEGELKEYEVPRPHEGIVMLIFPEIEKKENDDLLSGISQPHQRIHG